MILLRKPLLVAAAAVALTVLGAPPALAQPSGEVPVSVEAPADEPTQAPVEPDPVEPPADPTPADPEPTVVEEPTVAPEPTTPAPVTTDPVTVDPTTPAPTTDLATPIPTETATPTGTVPPSSSAAVTETVAPSSSAPPASSAAPVTNIDVDVDIDDHSDHSIHIDNSVKFIVEGDRYSSTYIYRDRDGKTYRGRDLDCSDFDTQSDAQAVLDSNGGDIYWLDADRDGLACEVDAGEFTRADFERVGVRRGGQVHLYPAGAIDTGLVA